MSTARPWITGIGLITPIGSDAPSFWESLVQGRNGARPVTSFDSSNLPNHVGCEVEEYSLSEEVRGVLLGGRCTELAAVAVTQAVADAGLETDKDAGADWAVVVGTTMGEVTRFEQDRASHADQEPTPEDVHSLAHRPLDVIGRSIARIYAVEGPVVTLPTACAAGAYAIGVASSLVTRGEARLAIAVGAEAFSRLAFVGFSRMRAMSPDLCRPFSLGRPGMLLGEGAGALIVESEDSARARGAEPLGFVDGFGLSCDAHHVTGPHPEGVGAARALREALKRGRRNVSEIDYVNAHGTGTPLNDKMESLALTTTFGEHVRGLPVSSIKALIGHTMGAAGALEAIASLLAMKHGVIPPTWNWVEADPACDIDCVPNQPRERSLRHVISNSYAFGGNNASLLLTAPDA